GMASATAQEPDVVTAAPDDAQIQAVLRRYRGNRAAAARHLGMSRTTLWRRLKQLADEVDEGQQ
ncbi:helix-turn-helix domain-containing protein, partial [Herbaspirillum frisingense]